MNIHPVRILRVAVNRAVIPLVLVVVPIELRGGRLASVTAGYGGEQPDACVRPLDSHNPLDATLVVATSPDPDESDSETDSEASQFEAKLKVTSAHLPQAVTTAIVHSFTQNTRHPELNPMVPTVLINGSVFRIVLYDCCKDMLLVSHKVKYREGTQMTPLGTLLLWLIINHR